MAITGVGSNYNNVYESTYAAQKNETAKKTETKEAASVQAGNTKKAGTDSVSDYYSYLQKNYDCVKNGNVAISGSYLKECTKNPEKAKELKENLSFFKEGYESGLKSAQANARAIGARLVNYSEKGRNALQKKVSAMKRLEQIDDTKELSSLNSGSYGIMNDFERIMSELGGGSVSDDLLTKDYSQESVDLLKAKFEKEEGTRTDTFDRYVNKMASVYQLMKDRIEEKYAASDRQKEYYVAADGSTQELTKEKELEMLDNAYETHSRFMATSTQIWSELQDFKVQTVYHSSGAKTETSSMKEQKIGVKEQAYNAFMSAINEKNSGLLKQEKGSLNHFRLDLNISSSARNFLNSIWNYHAGLRH